MTTEREAIVERLLVTGKPALVRFFRNRVPPSELFDFVQQTMLAYIESDGPKEPGKEKQYLTGIARNQWLRYVETKHRRAGEAFDSEIHGVNDIGPSLSSKLDRRNRVVAALHLLTADEQMAVELRHGEEMQLDEIAGAMSKSLATVKRYLASAEEKLRTKLADMRAVGDTYKNL
jgi:RNA polymerase sigma factor (sigma-70 family)